MDKTSKDQTSMRKMINGVKLAVFIALATNIYEVFQFVKEPRGFREGLGIALGIVATILLWQLSRELQAEKKQALYYWLGLGLIGYTRWIFIDAAFNLNVFSIILMALTVVFTLRIVTWVRNKSLT